jgi:hypothetical protein
MALGALISAYQEASGGSGELAATLPLAGRTLVEYQARLAQAAGASPVVLLVERMPASLIAAVDRLTGEGVAVQLARSSREAADHFAADDSVLVLADGLFADAPSLDRVATAGGPAVLTLADNIGLDAFERLDAGQRWAGLALTDGAELAATAAMLGDWDMQSTLLRRLVQHGARHLAAPVGPGAPMLLVARAPGDLVDAQRHILASARGARVDWVERYLTPILEEFAVDRLMGTGMRPRWLLMLALVLTAGAVTLFLGGARGWALAALVLAVPMDGIGDRLGALRMRPLGRGDKLRRYTSYAALAALAAAGVDLARDIAGWGALATAAAAIAFLHAGAVERGRGAPQAPPWLATRKTCILAALPFGLAGLWTLGLVAVAGYAAASFLWLQRRTGRKGLAAI